MRMRLTLDTNSRQVQDFADVDGKLRANIDNLSEAFVIKESLERNIEFVQEKTGCK